jgi:hypothetical protein
MKVCMLSTHTGAVDAAGTISKEHKVGEVYEVPDAVAKVYIDAGFATPVLLLAPEAKKKVKYAPVAKQKAAKAVKHPKRKR